MEERRRYPREGCLITAHVRSGKRIYEGTIVNICEDGCFVQTTAPLDDDATLQLRFRHPRTDATVKARAVVARRVKPGQGSMGLGLKLIDTLGMLEPGSRGVEESPSGTWSRQELLSRSGTWAAYDAGDRHDTGGRTGTLHQAIGDRRGVHTEDTGRTDAGRRRVRIQVAGGSPSMALLFNMSERGFSAGSERAPIVGKLLRLDLEWEGRTASCTAKTIWRSDVPGGLRTFGATVVQFSGHGSVVTWQDLLASLRA
ncbi:MAG: PilZ domain-containing protein [Deltaproteobacteria bacterium]|nr:PilZ domain-containing protein [Deltaproteobacteria bacterium]